MGEIVLLGGTRPVSAIHGVTIFILHILIVPIFWLYLAVFYSHGELQYDIVYCVSSFVAYYNLLWFLSNVLTSSSFTPHINYSNTTRDKITLAGYKEL